MTWFFVFPSVVREIVLMLAITPTVGAVNNWDYTVVARFLFGGSQVAADGMHDVINFNIIENTYENIEFELVGLYADDMSILLASKIFADESAFGESRVSKTGSVGTDLLFDTLEVNNHDHFLIAVDFYDKLHRMTDKELDEADFSRDEIERGLNEVKAFYGLSI